MLSILTTKTKQEQKTKGHEEILKAMDMSITLMAVTVSGAYYMSKCIESYALNIHGFLVHQLYLKKVVLKKEIFILILCLLLICIRPQTTYIHLFIWSHIHIQLLSSA